MITAALRFIAALTVFDLMLLATWIAAVNISTQIDQQEKNRHARPKH